LGDHAESVQVWPFTYSLSQFLGTLLRVFKQNVALSFWIHKPVGFYN